MRAAPNEVLAVDMRAMVLSDFDNAWEVGPRSAAELKEAAAHFDRCAVLSDAPAWEAQSFELADWCRSQADAEGI